MSVIVKGMKMPPKGEYTATIYVDSDGTAYIDFNSREMNEYTVYDGKCDLVEVPPHGRLIDADELEKCGEIVKQDQGYYYVKGIALTSIYNAPTIIEEER